MSTYVPYLAVGQIDRVRRDGCDAIAELANEGHLLCMERHYVAMLHPLQVDWRMIADYWRQQWLSSMAGSGLECLNRERMSTDWISYPICSSRDYISLVKLISQTLPCKMCGTHFTEVPRGPLSPHLEA